MPQRAWFGSGIRADLDDERLDDRDRRGLRLAPSEDAVERLASRAQQWSYDPLHRAIQHRRRAGGDPVAFGVDLAGERENQRGGHRGRTSEACGQHGYKGQIAIHELLQLNEAIREAILDRKPAATIRGIARTEAKLVSMAEDGLYKAIEGLTSLEEVLRVAFVNEYDAQTPWDAEEIYRICKGLEADYI